jgi:hypothetical protein
LLFTYSQASKKDVHDPREAFSLQKQTFRTSKHEISNFFKFLWVIFALLDPERDPGTLSNPDPDPQHWVVLRAITGYGSS